MAGSTLAHGEDWRAHVKDLTWVDAGSRGGFHEMALLRPFAHMYSFDADRSIEPGHLNFASFHHFPVALYSSAGEMDLHITYQPGMTSLLEPDEKVFVRHFGLIPGSRTWRRGLTVLRRQNTKLRTIDVLLRDQGVERVDFLKLDTQGTELEILKGAKTYLSTGRISIIKTEISFVPIYRDQCTFSDLDDFLRRHGFILVDCVFYPDAVHPRDAGKAIEANLREQSRFGVIGDAVYVLDSARLESQSRVESSIRSALMLNQMGYVSFAFAMLRDCGLDSARAEHLLRATTMRLDPKTRLKKFLKDQLPPWAFRTILRLHGSFALARRSAKSVRGS